MTDAENENISGRDSVPAASSGSSSSSVSSSGSSSSSVMSSGSSPSSVPDHDPVLSTVSGPASGNRLVLCVPSHTAGRIISILKSASLFDPGRKTETIRISGISLIPVIRIPETDLFLPLLSDPSFQDLSGISAASSLNPSYVKKEVPLKTFVRNSRSLLAENSLFFTDEQIDRFPAGRQMIGDIAVLTIPDSLQAEKYDIARALVLMDPSIRLVLNDSGIRGVFREPCREIIYPPVSRDKSRDDPGADFSGYDLSTVVTHEENGCHFRLDVMKLMFSKGNLEEKRRMSRTGSGETVVDMFCGIGYFTIPMAVRAKPERIFAIELNPVSFRYLCENIRLNHVEKIVTPVLGDCGKVTPEGVADRVLMGYVGTTHCFLDAGIRALKPQGGILHYHETVPEKLYPQRPVDRICRAAAKAGKKTEIMDCRIIKKYSPGVIHVVIDARIFRSPGKTARQNIGSIVSADMPLYIPFFFPDIFERLHPPR